MLGVLQTLVASQITNNSNVPGATVANALDAANTFTWTWADSASRLAQTVVAAQVGAVGFQTDMALAFQLLSVSPKRWRRLEDGAFDQWSIAKGAQGNISQVGLRVDGSTVAGTVGLRSNGNTNRSDARQRVAVATAAGAGSTAYIRNTGGANVGILGQGWRYRLCVVPGVVVAGMRWIYGIYDILAAPLTVLDPSTAGVFVNTLAMGCDRTLNDNLRIYANDATGAPTQVDLGASFPGATANDGYELELYSADGTTVAYNVLRLNTLNEISAVLSTNLPAANKDLQHGMYSTNNATASLCSADFSYAMFQQALR